MATFSVKNRIKIRRQAGNDCDVVINVPDVFQVAGTTFKFAVFEKTPPYRVVFQKTGSGIVVSGQRLEIPIAKADTLNKHGLYDWEMEAVKDGKEITIGMGDFELTKTRL
ncbi:hypothetical protein [Lacihabitans soyangensis]|uniref:Uncharacterized protein n=1 Tax=Lacihabitans soyangensis TaxID=869394 RepID=A0AAE3KVI1_9BACT|nr:hypothetical protein [Lacihabitans soyangensis]MCP9764936.1 hypothetical protein [Lacihabitans soyangensis]MCP9766223.1 hypothetical protein [Lacihabitans soyangensis]